MRNSLVIFKKEIRDTLRDRRTLMSMLVMPLVLMPLLILGVGSFSEYEARKSQEREIRLGISNAGVAADLVSFLNGQDKLQLVTLEGDASEAVRQGQVDIAIVIPSDWAKDLAGQTPVSVSVLFNSTRTDSSVQLQRVTAAVNSYDQGLIESRLKEKGIGPSLLSTPQLSPEDVATARERGGFFLGFLLPVFLVMWAVVGGMYTAIDVSAGEKERKTLEALLATPVSRLEIVVGKLLAVAATAVSAITLALFSLYVAVAQFGAGMFSSSSTTGALNLRLEPLGVLVMLGVGALLAVMFAALMLAVCIFAKGYREAQSYLTPLYLLAILPVVLVNLMPNIEPAPALFIAPAVNAVLLFKEVLVGIMDPGHILLTLVSLAIYAVVAVTISARIYAREGVLFRS
jgi:sodium transport system permease protein